MTGTLPASGVRPADRPLSGPGGRDHPRHRRWLTSDGRAGLPLRLRIGTTYAVVAVLHLAAAAAFLLGASASSAGTLGVVAGAVGLGYLRGLTHALDFDHLSMIDNSTRKFVAEGRAPVSVGLAFSAGHSTVVLLSGLVVVSGSSLVRGLFVPGSRAATTLGAVGLAVSGGYLLLVAMANLTSLLRAVQLRAALRRDASLPLTDADLAPRGPAARVLTAPLRRVRHPRHVYAIGMVFSLGFDTASQIGLLMLAAGAALAGASPLGLLAIPLAFAAAMTLVDTTNGLMMLALYRSAHRDIRRTLDYNIAVTGIGVLSGLLVGVIAIATLLSEFGGLTAGPIATLAQLPTRYAGVALVGVFAALGLGAWWVRSRRS